MVHRRTPFGLTLTAAVCVLASASMAEAQGVVSEWSTVTPPPAPVLNPVTVDPKTTALLVMDFVQTTCVATVRPRCVAAIPKVKELIDKARAAHAYVIYTGIPGMRAYVTEIAPLRDDPMIVGHADKFDGTDLDKMLRDHGITTVVPTGTAGNGAVLFTSFGAAGRGYKVVVPVDTMPGESPYAEQNAAWGLQHDPGLAGTVLTSADMLTFSQ
jgi:nicotinamidase-related amidase